MDIIVNDETVTVKEKEITLNRVLSIRGIQDSKGIAVAVNQNIIPRNAWDTHSVQHNDKILIITATQGG